MRLEMGNVFLAPNKRIEIKTAKRLITEVKQSHCIRWGRSSKTLAPVVSNVETLVTTNSLILLEKGDILLTMYSGTCPLLPSPIKSC